MRCPREAWAEWICNALSKGVSISNDSADTLCTQWLGMAPDPKAGAVLKDAEQDPLFRAILEGPVKAGPFFVRPAGRTL
jgi:hypothetical protein